MIQVLTKTTLYRIGVGRSVNHINPIEYATSSEGSSDALAELLMDDLEPILVAMGCSDREKEVIQSIEDSDELIQYLCDIGKNGLLIEFRGQKYKKDGKNSWRQTCVRFSHFVYVHDWSEVNEKLMAAIPSIQKITYQG